NTPWDVMVTRMLTALGDPNDPETGGPVNYALDTLEANVQAEQTAQRFLGLRMRCAQCHDHPFDVWTQDDYFGLAAFFAKVQRGGDGFRVDDGPALAHDQPQGTGHSLADEAGCPAAFAGRRSCDSRRGRRPPPGPGQTPRPLTAHQMADALAQATDVPNTFGTLGPRLAIRISDPGVASAILDTFGRCSRTAGCAPVQTPPLSLKQALLLIGGDTIQTKVTHLSGYLTSALKLELEPEEP